MLSHQPEVIQLIHREHVERLTNDAQQPLESVLPASHGLARVLSRLVPLTRLGSTLRRHGIYSNP
jgi:hypothetical protein